MHVLVRSGQRVDRPAFAVVAIPLELFTALGAIPVGIAFVTDPSGASMGLPRDWIETTAFGSYLVPGLYLLLVNGVAMLVTAGLTVMRHWAAPWMTSVLGGGLVVWILVQHVVMPENSLLQAIFLATGVALTAIGFAWLTRTGQLRLRER